MIKIKLLKNWRTKKIGDILNISKKGAEQFIKSGAGEYYFKEQTPKIKTALEINEEEKFKFFYNLLAHKQETEIRMFELSKDFKKSEVRGHFFISSFNEFLSKVKEFNGKYNLYAGLNERRGNGTNAKDVIFVKRIFLDIDCREKPANLEDLKEAEKVTDKIISEIEAKTGLKPTKIFSGNGYQLLYCIPEIEITEKNRQEVQGQIQQFSRDLIQEYSNEKVKIDNVGDLPRIIRITGTKNMKGGKISKFVEIHKEENQKLKDYILSLKPTNENNSKEPYGFIEKTTNQIIKTNEGTDTTRSGVEFKKLMGLIKEGKQKEEIYKYMQNYAKWSSEKKQYRDLSFSKAKIYVEKNKKENNDNNDLSTFIFDKNKIIQKKVFTSHMLSDSIFSFGLLLPREEDTIDNKGKIIGQKQVWRAVDITSERRGLVYSEWFRKDYKTIYEEIPYEMKLRWELEDIDSYLHKEPKQISGKDLFEDIKKQYEYYLYFRENLWYDIHALWDIATYLHQLFSAFPIFENRGLSGTAKTKTMNVSSYITLNATDIMVNPSEATLFRETNILRPTKYFDEAERLWVYNKNAGRYEGDSRTELINASYTKNGVVPRQEKYGNRYITKWYYCYSPTMLSSINGLFGATENRAITQVHTKAPDKDPRGEREPEDDSNNIKWKKIRNKCYLFALQNWKKISNEYLNFKIENNQKGLEVEIKKRDLQLWKPLLILSKIIDINLYDKLIIFAEKVSKLRKTDLLGEGTTDFKLLSCLKLILSKKYPYLQRNLNQDNRIYVNDIRAKFNQEYYSNDPRQIGYNKTLSSHLDKLGFKDFRNFDSHTGSYFEITIPIFNSIVEQISPQLTIKNSEGKND